VDVAKVHRVGTHRTAPPEETLRRISEWAGRFGITRVANVTGLDVIGLPVVAVIRPNSRSIAVAQGKGLDLTAAKVSGLMESIENHHAERIRQPLALASWAEMRDRGATIDIRRLPRASGGPIDPGARLLWIEGFEILSRRRAWIPFEVVHTDYTRPLVSASGAFQMSDSGVAAGNHPLEAISHGICELVERDAVALWQWSPEESRRQRRIDLDTVDDPSCRSVLEKFARAAVRVAAWEVTSDVGLAAFYATILDASPSAWRPLPPTSGAGCHPCREIALVRALTEAAQARLTVIAGARDDLSLAVYRNGRDHDRLGETVAMMEATGPARTWRDVPTYAGATVADDVAWELDRLRSVGIDEVAAVDLTLPEFGIPVARVVIPGLEGVCDAPGFTPGERLRARLS
jgi:ribosomal protein S12 methylthiotransferase accessory factor